MKELILSYSNKKLDIFMAEKEQEFFNTEINNLKEKLKDINWKINKDYCNKMSNYEKPPALFITIFETFMYILDQEDNGWNSFKV
jgi:hypothetical protein